MRLHRTWMWAVPVMLSLVVLADAQEKNQEKKAKQPPPKPPEGTKVLRDLEYVPNGHEREKLDLYLPKDATGSLPLVVWIHGGGWRGGNKEGTPAFPMLARGFAVASV